MEAAAVRVDAEREADVRAVVLREDLAGVVLEHLQLHLGRALEVLDLGRGPRIGRIRDRHRPHARPSITEHSFSQARSFSARAISTPRTRSSSVSPASRWPAPSSKPDPRFQRLAALPPYVLATVDELKSRLRAAGHDVYDFGLGNPDGASPRAAVERLIEEAQTPGNQRYMPSRGVLEARKAICDWYARKYGQSFDPDGEAVVTLGAKEGLAHLLLAIVGAGRLRAVARPVLSDSPFRRQHRGRRAGAGRDRTGTRRLRRDRKGARARAAQAQGPDRQLPAQPDQRRRRSGLLREGRRAGASANRCG